ncbi:MAG: TetR/AcrR family transcriptional regulator C-terminal domain-containing protein [Anaerovoracaceae bacterium]|jgi:AcrR family transcriptional regulator
MAEITKEALADTLMEMLQEKPLDQITIRELSERCTISRNTFYYHFHDIYELVEWIFVRQAQRIVSRYDAPEQWGEGIRAAMEYVYRQREMIYHVYNTVRREQLERYLYDTLGEIMYGHVTALTRGLRIEEKYLRMIIDAMKYALVGWALHWIDEGMQEEPAAALRELHALLDGAVEGILANAVRLTAAESGGARSSEEQN